MCSQKELQFQRTGIYLLPPWNIANTEVLNRHNPHHIVLSLFSRPIQDLKVAVIHY